jgi:2-oxoglutarate dehydrogenase E1 component
LLYPFPENHARELIEGHPNLQEIVWIQEEPQNIGAWTFMEPRLRELVGDELPVRYVWQADSAEPSTGLV